MMRLCSAQIIDDPVSVIRYSPVEFHARNLGGVFFTLAACWTAAVDCSSCLAIASANRSVSRRSSSSPPSPSMPPVEALLLLPAPACPASKPSPSMSSSPVSCFSRDPGRDRLFVSAIEMECESEEEEDEPPSADEEEPEELTGWLSAASIRAATA